MPVANEGAALACDHGGPGQEDVGAHLLLGRVARCCSFRHRCGLAGDGGVVGRQGDALDQPAVGRHGIALMQPDDVARHQLAARDLEQRTAALDRDRVRQEPAEGGERAFSAKFLPGREQAVEQDHADDRQRQRAHTFARLPGFGKERQAGAEPEDDGEKMGELAKETDNLRRPVDPLDFIGPEGRETPLRLIGGKAFQPAMQAGQRVFDDELMDAHVQPARRNVNVGEPQCQQADRRG
jgi:hypothetical protein